MTENNREETLSLENEAAGVEKKNAEIQEGAADWAEQEETAAVVEETEADEEVNVKELQAQVEALQEKVAKLEEEAAKNLDGWQRTQASFQNYRRRTEAEMEAWRVSANAALLARLLPILDDFERAFDNVPDLLEDHRWLDGIRLVKQKLVHLLETENVKPIEVEPGHEFDPQYHEAVLTQAVDGFEDGQIVAQAQRGYMHGERVLRPARVVVAKALPPSETQPAGKAQAEKETADEDV